MHVSLLSFIVVSVITSGLMTEGLQQNATSEIKCKTGKGIDGICSSRADCNFSTKNIDLTLYEPRGFKRTCNLGDVCCPPQYIIKIQEPKVENTDFTFNDDD